MEGIFSLETGECYLSDNHFITCHICNKTFSPVSIALIPTDLCHYYSNTYKRFCIIHYISTNICEHLTRHIWNTIFMGDIDSLVPTIQANLTTVTAEQPDEEILKSAWHDAWNKFKIKKDQLNA